MADQGPKSDTCPQCGKGWKRIRHENRVGCSYCFTWFHEDIGELFQRPVSPYMGQLSGEVQDQRSREQRISLLKKKLEDAVSREEFEKAKKYQDELNDLEKGPGTGGGS